MYVIVYMYVCIIIIFTVIIITVIIDANSRWLPGVLGLSIKVIDIGIMFHVVKILTVLCERHVQGKCYEN